MERLRILALALWPELRGELNAFQVWLTSPWDGPSRIHGSMPGAFSLLNLSQDLGNGSGQLLARSCRRVL